MVVKESSNCPICNQRNDKPKYHYDDRYGYPGDFPIYRCQSCGHRYIVGDFTPEKITNLYSEYYPRSTYDLNKYTPHRDVKGFKAWLNGEYYAAFRWVPPKVKILDIGCGFGETLGYHQARGCDVYGIEADENITRVAEKYGYKVHVGLFDAGLYEAEFFDYVTLDQVIEHVTNPLETMQGIAKVLKPGGEVILSTPNAEGWGAKIFGSRWIHWHTPYHLQFFSKKSMQIAAEKSGFVLEQAKTITISVWLHLQWVHLFTIPPKGEASLFWSPHRQLSHRQKNILKILLKLHSTKANHYATRFFDSLGLGDNYIFFLRKK